jgi:hypothetical protein
MPLDIPVGFAHVLQSLTLEGDADPMAITYGVELQPDVPLNPNVMAQDLANAFATAWASTLGAPYTLTQTEVRFPQGDQGGFGVGIFASNFGMANAGSFLPQNCAFLVHKRTALGGRRHRGRMYLPGVNEALVDNKGLMSSTAIGGVNAAAAQFLNLIVAVDGIERMVILHTTSLGPVQVTPTPVTLLQLDPVLGTQRRRLR